MENFWEEKIQLKKKLNEKLTRKSEHWTDYKMKAVGGNVIFLILIRKTEKPVPSVEMEEIKRIQLFSTRNCLKK